jgi:CBS domain-containing protein
MQSDVIAVTPEEHGHNRLPVVEHGLCGGVVTRLDVLRSLADLER